MDRAGEVAGFIGAIALFVFAQSTAHGQEAAAPIPSRPLGVVWHCWYGNEPEYATCFQPAAGLDASDVSNAIDEAIRTMAAEMIRNGNFIAATRIFRRFPEAFTGITRVIPLHTIPFDLEAVAWLAQSVMCARVREPCAVAFDLRWSADETRAPPFSITHGRRAVPY